MKSISDAMNQIRKIKTNPTNIIPFGKYKGQPVEILASDPDYVNYLIKDNWLQEKHPNIYQTIIVNNFQDSTETPEHNSLQVLFLEDNFCENFLKFAIGINWKENYKQKLTNRNNNKLMSNFSDGTKRVAERDEKYLNFKINEKLCIYFENKGVDITLGFIFEPIISENYPRTLEGNFYYFINIELKPQVGDDYPAVLRQMKANGSNVLFLKSYTGIGATQAQFIKTFELSDIKVIFLHEVM